MPIINSFHKEAQKYLLSNHATWFSAKVFPNFYFEQDTLRETLNAQNVESLKCIFPSKKRVITEVAKGSLRLLANLTINYLIAPFGAFYHGFYLGKKISPIILSKLLNPYDSLNVDHQDKNAIKAHFEAFLEDFMALSSTVSTCFLVMNRPLFKDLNESCLRSEKRSLSTNLMQNIIAMSALIFSLRNPIKALSDATGLPRLSYFYSLKSLLGKENKKLILPLLMRHYLGICKVDDQLLHFSDEELEQMSTVSFTKSDYENYSENEIQFNRKFSQWAEGDIFMEQVKRIRQACLANLFEIAKKMPQELDDLETQQFDFYAQALDIASNPQPGKNMIEDLRSRVFRKMYDESSDSKQSQTLYEKLSTQLDLIEAQRTFLKCAEYSFDLSHDFDAPITERNPFHRKLFWKRARIYLPATYVFTTNFSYEYDNSDLTSLKKDFIRLKYTKEGEISDDKVPEGFKEAFEKLSKWIEDDNQTESILIWLKNMSREQEFCKYFPKNNSLWQSNDLQVRYAAVCRLARAISLRIPPTISSKND